MTYNNEFVLYYKVYNMKTNGHIKDPNGLIHATATTFEMWAIHVELSRPSALQRIINVSIN